MASAAKRKKAKSSQRISTSEAQKPCCIVVLDHSGARIFSYWSGELSRLDKRGFRFNIPQWKRKDLGHVSQPGIKKTRGSQHDDFKHRLDAQYLRVLKDTAQRAARFAEAENLTTIFLVGPDRLIGPLGAAFAGPSQSRLVLVSKDFGWFPDSQLKARLGDIVAEWTSSHIAAPPKE